MPCNESGYTDPQSTAGWSIIDFDWSNAKVRSVFVFSWPRISSFDPHYRKYGQSRGPWETRKHFRNKLRWARAQVALSRQFGCIEVRCGRIRGTYCSNARGNNHTPTLEYRYESVRKTLEDPAYHDWYIKFKPTGPWYSQKCDSVNTTDCSNLYHNQEQSPGYPHGDGDCGAPNCDCGNGVPCGFYVWNHSSNVVFRSARIILHYYSSWCVSRNTGTTIVNNQTFLDWFRDDYVFDYQGSSNLVSGM